MKYTSGIWDQAMIGKDGKEKKSKGRYLAVWKRQKDGSWKVLVDKP